jgi:PKD repeat protein
MSFSGSYRFRDYLRIDASPETPDRPTLGRSPPPRSRYRGRYQKTPSAVPLTALLATLAVCSVLLFSSISLSPLLSQGSTPPLFVGLGPAAPPPLQAASVNGSGMVTASATSAGLTLAISITPAYGLTPLTARFTSTVNGGAKPYSYDWQFGDGATSAAAEPSHTYTSSGTYLVSLIVKDAKGRSVEAQSFVASVTVATGTLAVTGAIGPMSSMYWGFNYDFQTGSAGFDNASVVSKVQSTPAVWIRLPLTNDNFAYPGGWPTLAKFCAQVHCHEIGTVGGPGVTPAQAVAAMKRAASYGIHPEYWVFGNEPNIWKVNGHPVSGLAYANLVKQWITLARPAFPAAKFIGVEINGNLRYGGEWIYNVTKIDGHLITALAIQLYPQAGGTTVASFMNSLTVGTSIARGVPNAAALMKSACPTCSIPILVNEFQGGSGYNWKYIPFRKGFPDATLFAASIVQGLRVHLTQFLPWTLTGSPAGIAGAPDNCDMGLLCSLRSIRLN